MHGSEIQTLIKLLSRLPGLGPRSGRRVALALLKEKEKTLRPLLKSLTEAGEKIKSCLHCGNLDTNSPCSICTDARRENTLLCVVQDVGDLWALERSASYKGHYHVLGGTLSALEGRGPEDLTMGMLHQRLVQGSYEEMILALSPTLEGQTTSHYLADRFTPLGLKITIIAHGVPLGGELDYLDDGTLTAALQARRHLA